MGDEEDDGDPLNKPSTWPLEIWGLVGVFAVPFALIGAMVCTFEDDMHFTGPFYLIVLGVAIVEVSILAHFAIYPSLVFAAYDAAESVALSVWAQVPTIPWQPWHITTTGTVAVGPLLIGAGIMAEEQDDD